MKTSLLAIVVSTILIGGFAGCGSKAVQIVEAKPDSSHSETTPDLTPDITKGEPAKDAAVKDETVTPTESPAPTPAPVPAPAVDPLPTGPDKSAEAAPAPLDFVPAPLAPVPFRPTPLPVAPVITNVTVSHTSDSVAVAGSHTSEGTVKTFRCADGEAVTAFAYAEVANYECGEGTGGCADIHMAALKLTCSPLKIAGADNAKSKPAVAFPTGENQAGQSDAVMNSDATKTSCNDGTGIANGIFGRADGELRSFGLTCGHFHAWKEGVALLPTFNKTYSCDDYQEFGCSPGYDGTPFEASCGTNQAVVGLQVRFSSERVLGVEQVLCADLKPVFMTPIFPISN